MKTTEQSKFKLYLKGNPPPMIGLVLVCALALTATVGAPIAALGGIFISIRDKDWTTGGVILGLSAVFTIMAFLLWPIVHRMYFVRRNRTNEYIAITDTDFIYQHYDALAQLKKIIIPRKKILAVDFETVDEFDTTMPDSNYAGISYIDEQGKKQKLQIDYFFSSPVKGNLVDLLKNNLGK